MTPPRLKLKKAIAFPFGEYSGWKSNTLWRTSKWVMAVSPWPSDFTL